MPIRLCIAPTVQEAGESGRTGTPAPTLLQAGVEAVTRPLSSAPHGTATLHRAHRHSSTSDPESEEVTLPSPENLTAEISFSTRCSDLAKASRCRSKAVRIERNASPEPPRKLTCAHGLRQGAAKVQRGRLTRSS